MSSPEFTVGSTWPSLNEAKSAAENYIISRGESWKHWKSDRRCWIRICKNHEECDFRIRFNITAAGPVRLSVLIPHTCPRITHANSCLGHSVKFLVSNDRSRGVVADDRNIKPRQLVSEERLDRGNKINYQQAYRLREKLRDDIFGNEVLSFSKMPALIEKIQSSAYAGLEVDERSRFQRAWVLPKASENAMVYLRKFVAMDGAHCTSRHQLVLLAVTSLDGEGEILVLAWELVPVEDRANWLWFLQKIAPYLTAFQDSDSVIISNCLKGIASAVAECFPHSTHSYCSQHLCDNIRTSYGEIVAQKFWGCAYAKTELAFDKVLEEIREMNKDAAEYISNLPRD